MVISDRRCWVARPDLGEALRLSLVILAQRATNPLDRLKTGDMCGAADHTRVVGVCMSGLDCQQPRNETAWIGQPWKGVLGEMTADRTSAAVFSCLLMYAG